MADSDDEEVKLPGLPPNTKNYMTPACYRRLLDEREHLVNVCLLYTSPSPRDCS